MNTREKNIKYRNNTVESQDSAVMLCYELLFAIAIIINMGIEISAVPQ